MKVVPEDVSTAPLEGLASALQLTTVTDKETTLTDKGFSNKTVGNHGRPQHIGITYFHKLVQLDSKLHQLV